MLCPVCHYYITHDRLIRAAQHRPAGPSLAREGPDKWIMHVVVSRFATHNQQADTANNRKYLHQKYFLVLKKNSSTFTELFYPLAEQLRSEDAECG